MPLLTLCVIARDEEAMLEGCLASARDAVDEVVLVDTGSRDRTAALARAAGARVLEQPWADDFSAPRNLALAEARGDWVLQLDADERLAPGSGEALRQALRGGGFERGLLRLHNASRLDAAPAEVLSGRARLGEPQWLLRAFRRLPGVRYESPIHESPLPSLVRAGARPRFLDAEIVHLGAVPGLRDARAKSARNAALLRRRLEDAPGDVRLWGYLALELAGAGDRAGAAEAAERGWQVLAALPPGISAHQLCAARATLAYNDGDLDRALQTVDRLVAREGDSPDAMFLRGSTLLRLAFREPPGAVRQAVLEQAARALQATLATAGAPHERRTLGGASGHAANGQLGLVLLARRDWAGARDALLAALGDRPGDREAALGLAEARAELGEAAQALRELEPLLDASPDGWAVAARAAQVLGALDDARALLAEAARRQSAGFSAPHRRERAQALAGEVSR
ncbi:tetratricopeptide repeat-containing glycosyltransferase [Anaeromyxobacter paludicola]|uniref:Glycosyltransferase 2-like domain-containing protein n=1 Tax=Anaeromyxobacter paludicola TaxID=2918171 RepID=A0ABN6N1N1_9BACT|nr:glycosyltransferase [Anaeromyxobacter paludicola]BDG07073.1 hypothetical protein AMPC_01860 [Anaeromyxobacter paludicola]